MEVLIRPDRDAASQLVADVVARAIQDKPDVVLACATGSTMEGVYRLLVEKHESNGLDFSRVRTFNLDEYVGLAGDDPASYRHYMNKHLFDRVNIKMENTSLPNGAAQDAAVESERYESLIKEHGGIDLAILGIGTTGHIGFNEPLSSLGSRTRAKTLTPETRRQNARYFGDDPEQVPSQAITMGVGTILDSRRILMLATGESKAAIIAQAVEGPVTSMVTASALQMHPRCTVVVDEAAATELTHQEYYRWIFESETDWADYH